MPHLGPRKMKMYDDKYLIVTGTIMDDTYNSDRPLGTIMVFDKSDISTILSSSPKYIEGDSDIWRRTPYDFDIEQKTGTLLVLVNSAFGDWATDMVFGRMSDTHNPVLTKSTINSDGAIIFQDLVVLESGVIEGCDSVTIEGAYCYVPCGAFATHATN